MERQEEVLEEAEFVIKKVKDEPATYNEPIIHQMAKVEQEDDSSQEPAPECGNNSWSQTDGDLRETDFCLNQIFIKEEPLDLQEAGESSVEQKLTSVDSEVSGPKRGNGNSIFPEECAKPTVYGRKVQLHNCAHCSYKTPRLYHLKKHLRTHSDEKPFSCEFCDYKSSQLSHLKIHLRTHSGEKPFSCEFCDYKCSQSSSLKIHLRTHSREKPFSCGFCDFKSSQSSSLKRHLSTHSGEKPFSCEFCDYKCSHSSSLKRHLRIHSGENPFSCEFCVYKSYRLDNLKLHLRRHLGEKPFSCEFCDYKCSQLGDLKRHLRIMH